MRITSKGQVTMPERIRAEAGLLPNTEVEFEYDGKDVRIVKARTRKGPGRGERIVGGLRGSASVKMSTEQIMKLTRGR